MWGGAGNCVPGREVSNRNFLRKNLKKSPMDGRFCEKGVLNPRYFLRVSGPFRSRSDSGNNNKYQVHIF